MIKQAYKVTNSEDIKFGFHQLINSLEALAKNTMIDLATLDDSIRLVNHMLTETQS